MNTPPFPKADMIRRIDGAIATMLRNAPDLAKVEAGFSAVGWIDGVAS